MDEDRKNIIKRGEAFEKLIALPEWKEVVEYLEYRGNEVLQRILEPASGDGFSAVLSTESAKGALREIQQFPRYVKDSIDLMKQFRKTADE